MKPYELKAADLTSKLSSEDLLLLDVREEYEFEDFHIDAQAILNIPMAEVRDRFSELEAYSSIVVCCKTGLRAQAVSLQIHRKYPSTEIAYLEGGLDAYQEEGNAQN